jgi:glycosyltransferase involved in cell wall biosynthesis
VEPKISVVIPVYNNERYVGYCIESALSQTYPAWEVIVVDDGSTDDTPKILESFKGKISVRTLKHSGSPAIPRNVGIQWSTGNYIAFLDSDDAWFRDKLQKQIEMLRRYPEAGFVCGDFIARGDRDSRLFRHYSEQRFNREFQQSEIVFDRPIANAFRQLLARNFVGCASTVLLSRRVIDRIGGLNPSYPRQEDYEYWFRCAKYTRFIIMKKVLAYKRIYREEEGIRDIGVLENRKRVLLEVFSEHRDYLKEHRLLDDCFALLAQNDRAQAACYSSIGERRQALKLCLQSLLFSCSPENLMFWARASVRMLAKAIRRLRSRPSQGNPHGRTNRVFAHEDSNANL